MIFNYNHLLVLFTINVVNCELQKNSFPLISKLDLLNIGQQLSGQYSDENENETSDQFQSNETLFTVCYEPLGCFGRLDFYNPLYRPISLLPQSPNEIDMKLNLFTGKNKFHPSVFTFDLQKEQIEDSYFNESKPTKFIIHGFHGSYNDMDWMGDLKDLLIELQADKFNIFAVDWSKGASSLLYNQAVANTRVVGAAIAYFINKLIEYKSIDVTAIHFIGHSLGAHVSGYVGEKFIGPKIGKITGLDPAGPAFQENKPKIRLDRSDALYVEIIHTDAAGIVPTGFGLDASIGHDDYYPNGGSMQPGCGITKIPFNIFTQGITDGITNTIACNHQRSWELMRVNPKTLDEDCQFVGYECDSITDFEKGKCDNCGDDGSKCGLINILGEYDPKYGQFLRQQQLRANSTTPGRKLYFITTASPPYCKHHYGITIHFAKDMPRSASGTIHLDLGGSRRQGTADLDDTARSFDAGGIASKLITYSKTLGVVEEIDFTWEFSGIQALDPIKWFSKPKLRIENIEVNYMSNIDPKKRKRFSSVLCQVNKSDVKSGETVRFEKCSH